MTGNSPFIEMLGEELKRQPNTKPNIYVLGCYKIRDGISPAALSEDGVDASERLVQRGFVVFVNGRYVLSNKGAEEYNRLSHEFENYFKKHVKTDHKFEFDLKN